MAHLRVQARDAVSPDELDHDHDYDFVSDHDDYDDYWNPQCGRTADDYLILEALEESIGFACKKPKLGALLPGAISRFASSEPVSSPLRDA